MSDILSNTHKYTQNVNGEKKRNDSRKREGNIKYGGLNLQYKYFFVWRGGEGDFYHQNKEKEG